MKTAREVSGEKKVLVQVLAFPNSKRLNGDAELARKLLEQRNSYGLTLREVEAATGLSNPYLSQLENAQCMPSVEKLARLAAFYETTFDSLCGHMVEVAERRES